MDTFTLEPYTAEWADKWDAFVMERSANGTFLHTRRFLSYHPENRFQDASLLILQGREVVGVVPAADQTINGTRMLRSHPGSTFGGPVVAPSLLRAPKLVALISELDAYWQELGYGAAELKLTSDLFSTRPTDALQYALYHAGYTDELEIAAYLPLQNADYESLHAAYSFNKRYDLKKCVKAGLHDRRIETDRELQAFYDLLCQNLQKFGATPVHTLAELTDFMGGRLKQEVYFLGVYDARENLVAGACLFCFAGANVLHTQYLATDLSVRQYVPSAFLYDSVIRTGLKMGMGSVSFGTSTHDRGRVLNTGLIQNKEGYGSLHSLNRIYTKVYREA